MRNPFHYFFGSSIKRLVMASFVFVLLLPMGFFATSLLENSWENAQQGMLEKHHLIATAMVEPLTLFVSSRQQALQTLGDDIISISSQNKEHKNHQGLNTVKEALNKHLNSFGDLIAISYTSGHGLNHQHTSIKKQYKSRLEKPNYLGKPLSKLPALEGNKSGIDLLSSIFNSTFSNKPVILLKHYIINKQGDVKGALFSEISTQYITNMCSKISFGDKGHCAIIDQTGRVVAHPNKGWIKEIRDISKISIVQSMIDGKSGTTEFFSPFMKADMVAGFSAIPALGWGIMIPQPKKELTLPLDNLMKNTLIWLSLGILVALVIAYLLTKKITNPIRTLMKRTKEVDAGYDFIKLGALPKNSPNEIKQLWLSISTLLSRLQKSNNEVKKLNVSLNRDINKATEKLKIMNKRLYEIGSKDYLTSLANRRFFSVYLDKVLSQKRKEDVGIILIDIDKFKFINDKYGHEAGDLALKHLSKILQQSVRKGDLVARLGGDEFIVYIRDSNDKILFKIAENIRRSVEYSPLQLKETTLSITLSMGIVNHACDKSINLEGFLGFADKAMYTSKQTGRNQVSTYNVDLPENHFAA